MNSGLKFFSREVKLMTPKSHK